LEKNLGYIVSASYQLNFLKEGHASVGLGAGADAVFSHDSVSSCSGSRKIIQELVLNISR
jgi:hypothetical protein